MCRALFVYLFTLLIAFAFVNAAPTLEKRVSHNGKGTWYDPTNPGENGGNSISACNTRDKKSDLVVAMSSKFFNNNKGSNCNQWVRLKNKANGKVGYAQMRDSCEGCDWDDLDLTPAAFKQLAPLDVGVIGIEWSFMSRNWRPT